MADYNIYIHSDQANGSTEKTSAWKGGDIDSETSSWESKATKVLNIAQNPDSVIGGAVGKVASMIPAVAVAMLVVKLVDKTITTANTFITTESGDYSHSIGYNNFKATLKMHFTPFSSTINALQAQQEVRIENSRRQQQRELLGDSTNGRLSGYGV